jgi:protein SCO1/2
MRQSVFGLVVLVSLGLAGGALAHGTRYQIIQEETRLVPGRAGYANPPEPSTLGGPFELRGPDGQVVTDKSFPDKWKLVFFGYPSCREACPTALEKLTQALEDLGEKNDRVQTLFVDISMERPDPKGVNTFVGNFHPSIMGLTGTRAQIYNMVRLFKVRREYGRRNGPTETGPRIDHTTLIYLIGPDGQTKTYFHHALTPAEMTTFLRRYL